MQNVKLTDGHTVGVAGTLHQDRPILLAHTVHGTETETVFLDNDTALLVNFFVVEEQTGSPASHIIPASIFIICRHGPRYNYVVEVAIGVIIGL